MPRYRTSLLGFVVALVSVLVTAESAFAQIVAGKDAPVTYGHHHLNVTSIDVHKKFWVDGLGGKVVKIGTSPGVVIEFPEVLVFLREQAPTGGSKGSMVNHVGFRVPNLRTALDHLKAGGYPLITRAELPPQYVEKNDEGFVTELNTVVGFVMGPDDTKVELVEDKSMTRAIALDHVHFASPQIPEMRAWYVKTFGAVAVKAGPFEAADLPGVNLRWAGAPAAPAPTKGRVIDHIGFEVKNLEAFCRKLEADGIKLDRPYTKVPALNIAVAFITDPWGTYIELTEGLSAVP